ncbi:MAG: DUF2070 family protein [Candidatus Micrarchaeia archaeon]
MPSSHEVFSNKAFLRSLPSSTILFIILLIVGFVVGIIAVAIMGHSIRYSIINLVIIGFITGMLVLVTPTLLTVLIIKSLKRFILVKYILFTALTSLIGFSIFMLLGSAIYVISNNYAIASAIILVGDASIFAWWFIIAKVLLGKHGSTIAISLVQPTLNILVYIPYSKFIFTFEVPMKILLIKLYAAIFVFLLMGYMILYVFNEPFKKSVGFKGMEAMSQFVQDWLFNIDMVAPMGQKYGKAADIETNTFVFKHNGNLKAIFFIPDIHFGPIGMLGGSRFPYLIERFSYSKYRVPTFVMHTAVNLDNNPIASSQLPALTKALTRSVEECKTSRGASTAGIYKSSYGNSHILALSFGEDALVTFTRAPRVTEDISPGAAKLFRSKLEAKFRNVALLDAHNSRYESAPSSELAGTDIGSRLAAEYIKAISMLSKPLYKGRLLMGASSIELFNAMKRPKDLGEGNLNAAVFEIKGKRFAMIQFNANNMLPILREKILRYVKDKFGIDAEIYTTDTHEVNKLDLGASNVLGRYSSHSKILVFVDKAIKEALANMEDVSVSHCRYIMRGFKIWGENSRERLAVALQSVTELGKIIVPLIIAAAFIVAVLLILAI